ncbi:MAG TPA: hypothetical protein VIZ28_20055, partial [Chitinophagaceae bacterium]
MTSIKFRDETGQAEKNYLVHCFFINLSMNHFATHKMYYVALLCSPETDGKVQQFKYWMRERFGCTAALRSPAHITLIPP